MVKLNEIKSEKQLLAYIKRNVNSIYNVICIDLTESTIEIIGKGQQIGHFENNQFIHHDCIFYDYYSANINEIFLEYC